MVTQYFLTKQIAGNSFLTLNGGSFNLNKLDSAEVWEGENEDGDSFTRIILSFNGDKYIYLSKEGDESHKGGSRIYPHYEMSKDAFQHAMIYFGLDEESRPKYHGSFN